MVESEGEEREKPDREARERWRLRQGREQSWGFMP